MAEHPSQITALLFRRIGDSLIATPALRALKKGCPESHITVITEPQAARVFHLNPWIDSVHVVKRSPSIYLLTRTLRRNGQPDSTIDFLSDPRSAAAGLLCGSKNRVGFAYPGRKWCYTQTVAVQNEARPVYSARHKVMLVEALGIKSDGLKTEFYLKESDRDYAEKEWAKRGWRQDASILAIHVGSRRSYKRWPLEYYCELIKTLNTQDSCLPVILLTPGDESASKSVAELADLPPEQLLSIDDLGRLGAVLERCAGFIGNDGGPKHMAVAQNIPTVTIFGNDPPEYWTPEDKERHIALSTYSAEVNLKGTEALRTITPNRAVDAVRKILTVKRT